jgi:hypothetical protein
MENRQSYPDKIETSNFKNNHTMKTKNILLLAFALLLMASAFAQESKPKYAADVPEFLLTPDKVETELLGDLEFFDGMPSEATVQKSFDFLDLARGVEAFLNGMPAASIYAMLEGLKEAGLKPGDLGLLEN